MGYTLYARVVIKFDKFQFSKTTLGKAAMKSTVLIASYQMSVHQLEVMSYYMNNWDLLSSANSQLSCISDYPRQFWVNLQKLRAENTLFESSLWHGRVSITKIMIYIDFCYTKSKGETSSTTFSYMFIAKRFQLSFGKFFLLVFCNTSVALWPDMDNQLKVHFEGIDTIRRWWSGPLASARKLFWTKRVSIYIYA